MTCASSTCSKPTLLLLRLLPPVRSTTTRTFTFTHPSPTLLWQNFPRRPLHTALAIMHSQPGQCALASFDGLPTDRLTDKAVSIHGQYTRAFERITQYTVTDTIHRHTSHIYGKSRSHHQVLLKRLSQRGCRSPVARVVLPRRGRRRQEES